MFNKKSDNEDNIFELKHLNYIDQNEEKILISKNNKVNKNENYDENRKNTNNLESKDKSNQTPNLLKEIKRNKFDFCENETDEKEALLFPGKHLVENPNSIYDPQTKMCYCCIICILLSIFIVFLSYKLKKG